MKKVKALLGFLLAMAAGFVLVAVPSVAFADTGAYGTRTYFSVPPPPSNYKDQNSVFIASGTPYAYAATNVAVDGAGTAPTGRMGAKARLFKGSTLCKSSVIKYNGFATAGMNVYSNNSGPSCGAGTYHSDGFAYAWNGTGYTEHNTLVSPNLNL